MADSWQKLQEKFYRKYELYALALQLDLKKYKVTICPNGGPMAIMRETDKILVQNRTLKNSLFIYSSSGLLLSQFHLDMGRIVEFGWLNNEKLVCALEHGAIRIYDINGNEQQAQVINASIVDARVYSKGVVLMTSDFRFAIVDDFENFKSKVYDSSLGEPPYAWLPIPSNISLSRQTEVLMSVGQGIMTVDGETIIDHHRQDGPFTRLALSPNGSLLALFAEDGRIIVTSIDFQTIYMEFDSKSKISPLQMAWCGNDSIVLYWDGLMLILGPSGEWIKYSYEGNVFLCTEIDGCRIISDEKCEFLEKVPDCVEEIFKFGSTHPAALLYDAWDCFDKKDPRADEILRSIQKQLPNAIDYCVEAALCEFQPTLQKSLLKAACFGKNFADGYGSEMISKNSKTLRILNALRSYEIGFPMTAQQFLKISLESLVNRLLMRNHHLLVFRICQFLKDSALQQKVFMNWVTLKIKSSNETDEKLFSSLLKPLQLSSQLDPNLNMHQQLKKLEQKDKIFFSFAEMAKVAFQVGRIKLSLQLLENEKRPHEKIPLLLSMKQYEVALEKAVQSQDVYQIYYVMFYLKRNMSLPEFFTLITKHSSASVLLEKYLKFKNNQELKDFYYQQDKRFENACWQLQNISDMPTESQLKSGQEALKSISELKEHHLASKVLDDDLKLKHFQSKVEKELNISILGLDLMSTCFQLMKLKDGARVSKLKNEFRIPDAAFWMLRINVLAEGQEWEELDKFSRFKKSPVGYLPFAEVCSQHGNSLETKKYIMKCEAAQRPELYLKFGFQSEAIRAAFEQKNSSFLLQLRQKVTNPAIVQEINQMLLSLGYK